MNEFCQKVKSEVKLLLTNHLEHKKYIGNREEVEFKDDLRRRFILYGHINNPENDYNIEYSLQTEEDKNKVIKELNFFSINPKTKSRGNKYLVYMKDSESISTLLSILGATQSFFMFEDIRIQKSVSSDENRKVNFEVSNLRKTVNAGLEHEKMIKHFLSVIDKKDIPNDLLELCETRLKNLDKSYDELAEIMNNMTRSKINHRFRKIKAILKEKENEARNNKF